MMKAAYIPHAALKADSELDRLREMLSGGQPIEINTDGQFSPLDTKDKPKAVTIPKGVTSADTDTVGDLIAQLRGEDAPAKPTYDPKDGKITIPKGVTSADTVGDLINQLRGEEAPQPDQSAPESKKDKITIPKGVTSAPQWYETNKDLYNAEVAAMRAEMNDPNLQPKFLPDGRMYWVISCRPNLGPGYKTMTYKLLLIYDPNHPRVCYGSSVHVYLAGPTLPDLQKIVNALPNVTPKLIPHTLPDDEGGRYLCTVGTEDVSADLNRGVTSAVTSFRFAYRWLTVFELGIRDPKTWAKFQRHGEI